jgi:hypothetical protein
MKQTANTSVAREVTNTEQRKRSDYVVPVAHDFSRQFLLKDVEQHSKVLWRFGPKHIVGIRLRPVWHTMLRVRVAISRAAYPAHVQDPNRDRRSSCGRIVRKESVDIRDRLQKCLLHFSRFTG